MAQRFKTLDKLSSAEAVELCAIKEIGEVMAVSVIEFFKSPASKKLIKKLKTAGVNMTEETVKVKESFFSGKSVVFTGELKNFTRQEAQRLIRQSNGNVTSSVSRNTDFVVAGANPGSKYMKAKQLGINIIDEQDFSHLIK